jgi:serine/threonine protein kinase
VILGNGVTMTAGIGTQFRILFHFFFNFICRGYQAPEILNDEMFFFFLILFYEKCYCKNRYTFSSDYFSVGCVLYELATLNNPFMGKSGNINIINQGNVFFFFFFLILILFLRQIFNIFHIIIKIIN